ncbi:PREDICTED: uncharacterized protein LOC105558607 isoform X2 [Vollenhovia emeryi]|uniref:uncharacterized protein LOC105558607 isoform X2 n=1 Tax=Vollenhovia emeryi TaxID=411798 RepID=UPI0005F5106E|nr:PREDICTED: uncharacterized protein LOC105558607 isoform X2 [Vollenhovia emeryi]
MKINYNHLPVKVHYFFFNASMGAFTAYVPVYGRQLGISPLIMGSIIALLPIGSLLGKLLIGYAADYFLTWRKRIFMTLFTVTAISFMLMYFLPALPGPILPDHQFQNVSCECPPPCDMDYHASVLASCNGTKDTTCHWMCKDMNFSIRLSFHGVEKEAIISPDTTCLLNVNESSLCQRNETAYNNCNVTCDIFEDDRCLYTSVTFWGFVILMFFGIVGLFVSASVNDTICFDILGTGGQMKYGKQRLWGSVGFSLVSLVSGYTTDLWSQGKIYKTYTPAFILMLVFIVNDLICCRKLKLPLVKSPSILTDLYTILKLLPIIIFLCTAIIAGILETLTMYMEDLAMTTGYMSQIKLIEGLTLCTGFLGSKVIFFFISGRILKKLGYGYTLTICFLCCALRMGFISLVPTPWYVILVEGTLQGPTYALLYATIVTYASVISPPGTSATVQAIAAGMKEGLGYMIGSFLAGFLFEKIGGRMTFRAYSGLAAFAALMYFILYVSYLRHTTIYATDARHNVEWRNPDDAQKQCEPDET